MKTTHDVLDLLYKIVNVSSVTSTIDGRVYRRKRPIDSAVRDIVLTPLPIGHAYGVATQEGTVVINCYARNLANGMADESTLEATADAVISVIESYSAGSTYLVLLVTSENIMQDMDDPEWSYTSIRVRYFVES